MKRLTSMLKILRENLIAAAGIALFIFILLYPVPAGSGLGYEGKAALAVLVLVFSLWVTETLPIGATSWLVGILVIVLGIKKDPNEVWSNFGHSSVFFLMGSFIMSQGLIKYNIHKLIALRMISITGSSVSRVVFGLIITSGLLAAFVSDHLVAAMMLPLAVALVESLEGGAIEHPRLAKLLVISIAFSVNSAGYSTPSGAARNLIIMGYLKQMFGMEITYLEWMKIAFPIAFLILLATAVLLPKIIKSEIKDLSTATEKIKKELSLNGELSLKGKAVLGIFLATIALFITAGSRFGLGTIAMLGAFLMIAIGAIAWNDVRKISWNSIFLYGAALTLGGALKDTNASSWLAGNFLSAFSINTLFALTLLATVISLLNTQIMADGPNAAIIGPIVLGIAAKLNLNPIAAGMAVVIPGSFAYMTIVGTPPNAIVYGSGYLEPRDFLKYGLVQTIIALAVWMLIITTYWRIIGLL